MSPTQPLPPKKDVALALLEQSSVHVHLDPRLAGVVVPIAYKTHPQLVLQVGLNMKVPIPDLRVDDEGMSCTLSFNRSPFFCVVPWASVFAMVGDDGRPMVWPDDVPSDVARQAQQVRSVEGHSSKESRPLAREPKPSTSTNAAAAGREPGEVAKVKRPRKRPVLAAVSDPGGQDSAAKTDKAIPAVDRAPRAAGPTNARPAVAPVPSPKSIAGGSRKKKRDLPPYLRVVK